MDSVYTRIVIFDTGGLVAHLRSSSAPINTIAPAITGTETVGQTLSVSNGTWDNSPTSFTYQWYRAVTSGGSPVIVDGEYVGIAIVGATSNTYLLDALDAGEFIFCEVTATNAFGSATAQSNATGVIAAPSYTGPGDLKTFRAWYGLRAYSAATIGGNALDIRRASDLTTQTFITLADGSLDVASIATFLAATTGKCTKLYDQTGNGFHVTANHLGFAPAFNLADLGSLPTLTATRSYPDSAFTGPAFAQSQPFSMSSVYMRTTNTTEYGPVFGSTTNLVMFGGKNTANQAVVYAGADIVAAATDNTWHAVQGVFNGASSFANVDGSSGSTGDAGSNAMAGALIVHGEATIGFGFGGKWVEGGIATGAFSAGDCTALDANQAAYWGI